MRIDPSGPSPGAAHGVGSARGKLILAGEHAVVYGVPAVACGIALEARATAALAETGGGAELRLTNSGLPAPANHLSSRALRALLQALRAPPMRVQIQSAIPPGCGLGASAAFGVAAARAARATMGRRGPGDVEVLEGAAAWERVFHGTPSGLDVAAVMHGGCIRFVKGEAPAPVRVAAPLALVVAMAGPPASTREMVERVARVRAESPRFAAVAFDAIREISAAVVECLQRGDRHGLGDLLDQNHGWLSRLELSTPLIEEARAVARSEGALGTKVTGSGGGGAVIALVDGDPGPVLRALASRAIQAFPTTVQATGEEPRR
jgi:mevalonate kinase